MKYEQIDPIIDEWAIKHQLHIFKEYKDYDVRSIDIVDGQGNRYQIWVELSIKTNNISVHAWDYRKRKVDYVAEKNSLLETLEKAYQTVNNWMK